MRWVLRLFGFPIFDLSAEEPDWSGYGGSTGGQFEIAQGPVGGQEWEISPDDPEGFGFRSS